MSIFSKIDLANERYYNPLDMGSSRHEGDLGVQAAVALDASGPEQTDRPPLKVADRITADASPTAFSNHEIRKATETQGGDMVLPKGTVLSLLITEAGEEKDLGFIELGSELRVSVARVAGIGESIVSFYPSSDKEGQIRREKGKIDTQITVISIENLADIGPIWDTTGLEEFAARLQTGAQLASGFSRLGFIRSREDLLRENGVDPNRVNRVELRAPVVQDAFSHRTPVLH